MKKELIPYYVSRAILAELLGLTLALSGSPWWV